MKKRLGFIVALLLTAALLTASAAADWTDGMIFDGDSTSLTGKQDRSVFIAGQTADSSAEVDGLSISASYNVSIGGQSEYAISAGYSNALSGKVLRDAVTAGYSNALAGNVGRDAYIAGNSISITGQVGRNLYAAARTVTLNGEIGGDAYIAAESIYIGGDTVVKGTLHYNGDANVTTVDNSGIANTEIYQSETPADAAPGTVAPEEESSGRTIWSRVCSYLGVVAVAFVLLWLSPLWETVDRRYTGKPFGKYASAFGIGFGVLAGVPVAAILLMITGIGLRLAFVLLTLYTAALLASPVFLGFFLGSIIWRKLLKKAVNYWAELPIGIFVWWLASQLPVLEFVAGLVAAPLGLGVLVLLLGKGGRDNGAAPVEAAPAALPEAAQEGDIPQQ